MPVAASKRVRVAGERGADADRMKRIRLGTASSGNTTERWLMIAGTALIHEIRRRAISSQKPVR